MFLQVLTKHALPLMTLGLAFLIAAPAAAEVMTLSDDGYVYDEYHKSQHFGGSGDGTVVDGWMQAGYEHIVEVKNNGRVDDVSQLQKGVVYFELDPMQLGYRVGSATLSVYLHEAPATDIGDLMIEHRGSVNNDNLQKQDHQDTFADTGYRLTQSDATGAWYGFDVTGWIQADYDAVSNANQLGSSFRFGVDGPMTDSNGDSLYDSTQLYVLGAAGFGASNPPVLTIAYEVPTPGTLAMLGGLALMGGGFRRPTRRANPTPGLA